MQSQLKVKFEDPRSGLNEESAIVISDSDSHHEEKDEDESDGTFQQAV